MSLHRAEVPDWTKIPADQWNVWQRLAFRTKGILTPANVISLVGALIFLNGLLLLDDTGTYWMGLILVLAGRLADIADGYVADITSTKSPLGEAVDATLDKVLLGIALLILAISDILPASVVIILVVYTVYNTVVGTLGRMKRRNLHPSQSGKFATALLWICIGLFIAAYGAEGKTLAHNSLNLAAWISLGCFIVLAISSSYTYTRQYLNASRKVQNEI